MEHGELRVGLYVSLDRAIAPTATRAEREHFVDFLRSTLIPHAQVEERVLYPALEAALQTRGLATATLVLDHRAIAQLTQELAKLTAATIPATFESRAQELAGIVERHFQNEEEFLFPHLARKMNDRSLRAMLRRMETERIVPVTPR